MKIKRPAGHIIYDLDGVLLDTEHFYTEVTQEIVAPYGKVFDWSVKSHMIGRPSIEAARYLVRALELPISAEDYLELRGAGLRRLFPQATEVPGAEAFCRRVDALGVRQGVGSSSETQMLALKTSRHQDWFAIFAAIVCGDDPRVHKGKPAPDIFLAVAEELGAAPESCVVFEDAPSGVAAAKAAGMQVVALPDPAMGPEPYTDADLVIGGFAEIEPADLGLPGSGAGRV